MVGIATSTTSNAFSVINSWVSFGSNLFILVFGALGTLFFIYKACTGGFGFIKVFKKINKFIDRVDVLVDDFWPEILGGLESKGFISAGAGARWTSSQARILKATSPIKITPTGKAIIEQIKFDTTYSANISKIEKLVEAKLKGKTNLTDLDLEQASLQVGSELFDNNDAIIIEAKKYLFDNPKMAVSELKALIGIYIRDQLIDNPKFRSKIGLEAK